MLDLSNTNLQSSIICHKKGRSTRIHERPNKQDKSYYLLNQVRWADAMKQSTKPLLDSRLFQTPKKSGLQSLRSCKTQTKNKPNQPQSSAQRDQRHNVHETAEIWGPKPSRDFSGKEMKQLGDWEEV